MIFKPARSGLLGTKKGSKGRQRRPPVGGRAYAGLMPICRELMMTASHAGRPQVLPRPACTPAAIRAVLAANADPEVLLRYDNDLDRAFEEAREHSDLTPLVETVRRWWFEADAWRDPEAQREFLARVERYQREGPPPATVRTSWDDLRA